MTAAVPETVMMADHGEVIAVVRTLQDAVDLFRLMKQRLGLTNEFIDEVGGLTKGHTDKVLGRSEQKRLGYDTFALFAEMFAVEFRVHINLDAVKRMEAVWEGRERPLFPHGKPGRISKKIMEAAKPHIYRDSGRAGGLKRAASLPAKLRSRIARKGGKSRMRKVSKTDRTAMCLKGWKTRRKKAEQSAVAPQIGAAGTASDVGRLEFFQGGVDKAVVLA